MRVRLTRAVIDRSLPAFLICVTLPIPPRATKYRLDRIEASRPNDLLWDWTEGAEAGEAS